MQSGEPVGPRPLRGPLRDEEYAGWHAAVDATGPVDDTKQAYGHAFVLLAAWTFKRLFAGSFAARAARRSLQIVDVLPLGGKQRLAVVRCYERTFVVGIGDCAGYGA